jgi:hypothetical protein
MTFDPRVLNDPILMKLLEAMAQQGAQQGGAGIPAQSNPNIYQQNGVWMNRPVVPNMPEADPLDQALANKPFILEGDYMSQQYYGELEAQQKARQMAEALARQERQKHLDALQLESLKQTGETGRTEIRSRGDLDKQMISSLSNILDTPDVDMPPTSKVEAIKQLFSGTSQITQRTGGGPITDPYEMLVSGIESFRKAGKSEDWIRADIMSDAKMYPQYKDAADRALEYLEQSKPKTAATPAPAPRQANTPKQQSAPREPGIDLTGAARTTVDTAKELAAPLGTEVMNSDDAGYLLQQFIEKLKKTKGWTDEQTKSVLRTIWGVMQTPVR